MMERNTLKFLRFLLLPALLLCSMVRVFAIDEPDRSNQISLGSTLPQSFDDAPFNQSFDPGSVSITNSISLRLNEQLPNYIGYAFTAKVTYDLTYTDLNGQTTQSLGKWVSVSYNPGTGTKYDAESYFAFRNAKTVTVTVTGVDISSHQADVMTYLVFTNRFHSKRDYNFNYNLFPTIASVSPTAVAASWQTPDELNIAWQSTTIDNGSDIDVEWAWVNTSDGVVAASYQTNGAYDQAKVFADNATRVTVAYNYLDVKNPTFRIPLLYESGGTVFFRVRFAQLKNDGTRVEGVWNTSSQLASNLWQFAFNGDQAGYKLNGHMPEMNWQATTSFAEEGKRKTVISYFDGTLRTRQTVTKDNSIEQIDPATGKLVSKPTTVVAETMYDYQGRPVIQVLPAPTINNLVEYTHRFNVFAGRESKYPKEVYDILAPGEALCAKAAPALSTGSVSATGLPTGAANYYSPNNPWKNTDINGKYIPDANGFPFTETRYTTDGTGRVEAQGGVGEAFRLGNGHETKYYYSQADQTELDGLFGTDVGYASHYFKSVVKDANGQYSVSYTDMYGKTIATALAGDNPANLKPLPSLANSDQAQGNFQTITKSLLGSNVAKGSSLEAVSSVLLTKACNATFDYVLDPQNLKLGLANCNNLNICYDCKYNLEITVSGSCGGPYTLNGQPGGNLPYRYTSPDFDLSGLDPTDCNSTNPIVSASFTLGLNEGEYTVTKSLRINTQASDWYLNNRVLRPAANGGNICKAQADIANDFLAILDQSDALCKPDCNSCIAALGSREDYITNTLFVANLIPNSSLRAQIGAAWDNKLETCKQLCNAENPTEPDELATIKQQMLADMTPPSGQYARLNETLAVNTLYDTDPATGQPATPQDFTGFPFNIFNANDANVTYPPAYKWPSKDGAIRSFYLDINGNTDQTIHPANQTDPHAKLNGTSAEGFSSIFKDPWANSLLAYHPEYAKLQYAEQNLKAVYQFNTSLFNTDKYADAYNNYTFGDIVGHDPFYAVPGSNFGNNINNGINNFSGINGLSMWKMAAGSVLCPDQIPASSTNAADYYPCTTITNEVQLKSSTICDADKDRIWQAFRAMYTSERKKLIADFLNSSTLGLNRYNFTTNPNNYTERFINLTALQARYQPSPVDPDAQATAILSIAKKTRAQYQSIAQSYVPKWTADLMGCQNIGGITDSSDQASFIKSITDELVKICVAGSDTGHPAGSSTCVSRTDGGTYLSFEAVIADKLNARFGLTSGSYTTACNPYIIDWPKPYDFPVVFSYQSIDGKDQCVCDRITALTSEKNNRGLGSMPLGTYLLNYYQVTVAAADLDRLSAVCNATATCNTLSPAISLPPLLQCGYRYQTSCADCSTIQAYDAAFRAEFPGRDAFGPFADPANGSYTDDQVAQHLAANRFYARYLNKKTGFGKSYDEYAAFLQQCGTAGNNTNSIANFSANPVTTNASQPPSGFGCTQAQAMVDRYLSYYTRTDTVFQTDMVTLAGNPTPAEGPKGVFDVNGNLIGNTIDSPDPGLIKASFVQVWNGSTADQQVGTLSLLSNGRFGLQLKPGQLFPCKGIVGMRYWQFDTQDATLDGAVVPFGTYADLGDSTRYLFSAPAQPTTGAAQMVFAYGMDYKLTIVPVGNIVHTYSAAGPHTVTLYHTDTLGRVQFDNIGASAVNISHFKNLRGYFPEHTIQMGFHSTQDSTMNTFDNIRNAGTYHGLQYFNYGSGDGGTKFLNNHLDFNRRQAGLHTIWLDQFYSDQGTHGPGWQPIIKTFPGWDTVYTELDDITIISFANNITPDVHFRFPHLKIFNLIISEYYTPVAEVDRIINEIAASTTEDNGFLAISQGGGIVHSAASEASLQLLRNRGWKIRGDVVNDGADTPGSTVFDESHLVPLADYPPYATPFTDYLNSQLGTHYSKRQVDSLYAGCGGLPNLCTAPPHGTSGNGPFLCDTSSVIPPVFAITVPTCDQQHATLAAALAEDKYTLELGQIKGDFQNAYNQKCLSAINLEKFTVTQQVKEYHYTLYYYDQAGNLVQTVPPAGVAPRYNDATFLDGVRAARTAGTAMPNQNHTLVTRYLYNSLNQVVLQHTPDAGTSKFFYDYLGRLAVSQNAEQAANGHGNFSYTLYDILGRITEVGQKNTGSAIDNNVSKNPTGGLDAWLAGGHNYQITRTVYDQAYAPICSAVLCQQNLRNRVGYTQVLDDQDDQNTAPGYRAATFYSYDIHGNVGTLVQDYAKGAMGTANNRFKTISYDYDLISGKVNRVAYQAGYADGFYHRYSYDAENRLTAVQTSRDQVLWQNDAQYSYYRHGPLARTQLGQLHVQGIDYAYSLQGWLKAINPSTVAKTGGNCPPDMGGAGVLAAPDILDLYDRSLQPPTPTTPIPRYIARQQVIFEPSFISLPDDNFETYIDANATIPGNTCNADPNAVDLFDDDGTNNKLFARDAHAIALNYYDDGTFTDYTPIGVTAKPNAMAPALLGDNHPLYNGNISSMAVNIRKLAAQAGSVGAANAGPMLYNYRYDQLNRIASMDAFKADGSYSTPSLGKLTEYAEQYTYDPNGNILTLNRNGTTGQTAMDQMAYGYERNANGQLTSNKLRYVFDAVPAANYPTDIDNQTNFSSVAQVNADNNSAQSSDNYRYDAIGNMVHDEQGKINTVAWTVYGKIDRITKNDGSTVQYTYDASGNRISKVANGVETWYVRDATGNVMATYTKGDVNINSGNLTQAEVDLYGSSRLGLLNTSVNCSNGNQGPTALGNAWDATYNRGQKLFELTNHLGNVLATVTDRLVPVPDATGTTIDHNLADVASANDYYSFGMAMPGRTYSATTQYRYGFNGKENDRDISDGAQDYGARILDNRLGRFLSVDPLQKKYSELSPFAYVANSPLIFTDVDGRKIILTGTAENQTAFVAKLKFLTGLDLNLKNGEVSLASHNIGNGVSAVLRNNVTDLLDEKGKNYKNNVIVNLVRNDQGFKSDFLGGEKQNGKNTFFDAFITGAVDLDDYDKVKNNVFASVLLGHMLGERAAVSNGDYKKYLESINSVNRANLDPRETEQIEKEYNEDHLKGILVESEILNDFLEYPDGTKPRLELRQDFDKDLGAIILEKLNGNATENKNTFRYGAQVTATINSDPKNKAVVTGSDIKITSKNITSKNGAIDKQ